MKTQLKARYFLPTPKEQRGNHQKDWGAFIDKRLVWFLAAGIASAVMLILVYTLARGYVLNQVEKRVRDTMLECRAFHQYVQHDMHPAYYDLMDDGRLPQGFYAPELLSSSYIVRTFQQHYNEERRKAGLPEVYYKMAAIDARNPVNEANAFEHELITWFNEDKTRSSYREIVEEEGERYLLYARPFLPVEQRCLKCHGAVQDAPAELRDTYHWTGGWDRKVGDIVAAEVVRSPLEGEYSAATAVTGISIVVLGAGMILLTFNNQLRTLVSRRTEDLRQSEKRLDHLNRVLAAIRNVNQLITREKDRVHLLDTVCRMLVETHGFYYAWIALVEDGQLVAPLFSAGFAGESAPEIEHLHMVDFPNCVQSMLKVGDIYVVTVPHVQCAGCPLAAVHDGHVSLTARLDHAGCVFGWLSVSVPRAFAQDEEEQALFVEVGDDIAFALWSIEAETQRQTLEQKYAAVLSTTSDAVISTDLEGKITLFNPGAEQLFGYSANAVLGKSISRFCPEDKLKEQNETLLRVRETGTIPAFETERLTADGQRVPVEMTVSLRIDEEGRPNGINAILRDIAERKQAEAERELLLAQIRDQAQQMEKVLSTVPEGVVLLDAEGYILHANPVAKGALAVLAGTDRERRSPTDLSAGWEDDWTQPLTHLGDRPLADLLTSPLTKGLWHEVKVTTEADYSGVSDCLHSTRVFEIIARPVEKGSQPEHWVLVLNDVTRERQVREQLQQQERLAAVGQLAAGIAHDFNNIMATIVLYAQMATKSQTLSPRDQERMNVITQQAWHATRLIEQILDFSRRAVLERCRIDVLPLLKEQVKLLERTLPEHIQVSLDYKQDTYIINADPTRIQQVITNLAVNARDAMPDGGRLYVSLDRITLAPGQTRSQTEMEDGEWIQLTMTDTGTGIPADVLPHIFEPFFTTKGPGQGNGLGLAQVHGIVGQHGGYMDVETEMGKGTTFTLYFPAQAVGPTSTPTPETSDIPYGHGETVLVVEDEATLRAALIESLQQWGYQTLQASNGLEALAVLEAQEEQVALIVSDVVMPRMGGIALFHALQEKERRLSRQIPMLLLTGHPLGKELEALREKGLRAWLLKPPSFEQLAQEVAKAVTTQTETLKVSAGT